MLTKRRCTATGVINFFSRHEPHIAVGTVIARGGPVHYVWHFHGETGRAGGTAHNWLAAERAINEHYRQASQASQADGKDRFAA